MGIRIQNNIFGANLLSNILDLLHIALYNSRHITLITLLHSAKDDQAVVYPLFAFGNARFGGSKSFLFGFKFDKIGMDSEDFHGFKPENSLSIKMIGFCVRI